MLAPNQARRAGATAVLAMLLIASCRDSVTDRATGLTPGGPSFAAGGSISVNLDQCANNVPRGGDCTWQNGDLNGNNSQYAEGLAIPFRLTIDGLKVGTQYQIHLNYDWTAGGHKAYDFLASDNATEQVNVCAAGGGGVPNVCSALPVPALKDFPENNFPFGLGAPDSVTGAIAFAASPQGGGFVTSTERKLKLYNGTIDNITLPVHFNSNGSVISGLSDLSGNTSADAVVTFTATASSVLFTWSAHLAQSAYWDPGSPNGADQISGAPWHMRTQQLQTSAGVSAGNKNQDRSIQPSAIIQPPVLDLSKTADSASVSAGSQIGFTITAHNTGAGPADGFALTDTLPTGTGISWSIASQSGPVTCAISSGVLNCPSSGTVSFAAGGTLTVHITSSTAFASCATYSNTATVSLTNGVPPSPATAQVTVKCPKLVITKTADSATVTAGSQIGFTITVSDTGQGTAKGVTLVDSLPTGSGVSWSLSPTVTGCSIGGTPQTLNCTFGDIATGGSKTVHVISATTAASCQTYSNTAKAQATNHAQVTATASEDVICGMIDLTKTTDSATVSAGSQISFTITAANNGQGDVTNVVVTDTVPTQSGLNWTMSPTNTSCTLTSGVLSCNFGTLAHLATASVHIVSPTTFASCALITNKGRVATGNAGTDSASAQVTVKCPKLVITKTADSATVSAGSPIGFTIAVSDTGQGVAKSVTLVDSLPTGSSVSWTIDGGTGAAQCSIGGTPQTLTCSFGDIAPAASKTVHVTSSTAFSSCKLYSNTAKAQATNHALVQASASTTVQCPSLTITKTPDPGGAGYTLHPGDSAKFTITVTNTGSGSANNVVIRDTLPVAPTPAWVSNKPVPCPVTQISVNSVTRDLLTCTVGTLAPSASFTVQVASLIPANYLFQGPSQSGDPIEIDGNLADGLALGKDWADLGISCTAPVFGCDLDLATGSTDNSFGQGTKEDTPVPSVVFGSIPNNKSDLLRFYVDTARFGTTDYLYLAWERVQAPKGTTNMDFELNQSDSLSANGVTPKRTAGDLLIKFDLSSGGTNPVLGFHKWVTSASAGGQSASAACEAANSFPCWGKVKSLAGAGSDTVAAAINTDTVTDVIAPGAPRLLDPLTFGEARINLEASGIFQTGVCVNFGKAYLKSRSSDSFTAEIKDFIAPIRVGVSNCQNKFLSNRAWATATNLGSAVSDTAQIEVTESQSASASILPPTTRLATKTGTRMTGPVAVAATTNLATTISARTISSTAIATATTAEQAVVTGVAAFQPVDFWYVVSTAEQPIPMRVGLARDATHDVDRRPAANEATALSDF